MPVDGSAGHGGPRRPPGDHQVPRAPDLTWRELADALWLAAVQANVAEPASTAPPPAPATGDSDESDDDCSTPGDDSQSAEHDTDRPDSGGHTAPLTEAYLRTVLSGDGGPRETGTESARSSAADSPVGRSPGPSDRRVPGWALPDSAAIERGLRPFKRTVPSRSAAELDEEVTARRAAEDGKWLPYTKPVGTRWLDLTIVVDEGPSMPAWRETVAKFTTLLSQLGAFRDVRPLYLDLSVSGDDDPAAPRVILRGTRTGRATIDPAELLGLPGRRLILVLTDGLGPVWRTGAARRLLATWGQSATVAVIHLFPQQSWHRTAVNPYRVRLRVPDAAAPNRWYVVDALAGRRNALDPLPEDWSIATPIPVLELERDWLARWARVATGQDQGWHDTLVLLAGSSAQQEPDQPGEGSAAPATGREQVLLFRASASPTAVRLASHMAATPLEPSLIDRLRRTMLPESRPEHLAEIWAAGLIRPVSSKPADSGQPVSLEFIDGAREALLASATRADTAQAFAVAADHYGNRTPATKAMRSALAAPDQAPDPPVNPETLPFVQVELAVLRALSGPYLSRARRLGRKVAELDRTTKKAQPRPRDEPGQASDLIPDGTNEDMNEDSVVPSLTIAPDTGTGPADATPEVKSADTGPHPVTTVPSMRDHQGFIPPVWNVPPKNVNFTGREDLLAELHEKLRKASKTAAVTPNTLHGMGGVGKSQIAIEYVYRHVDDYDIIWWIPAEQPSQILASLAELAQSLKLDVGTEANTAVPAVRDALRSGNPYKNWLLVFDNAEDIAAVREYFPTGGFGKILVTSRNRGWADVADSLSVDVFRREESKELLRRRNTDLSDTEADQLAEALGDLPLAIEQAASWHAATGMAVDEYLSLIDAKRLELLDDATSPDYSLSVAAAWNVSLDRLEESNRAALQLLQICAFMAPEPIPRSLFRGSRNVEITPEMDEILTDPIKLGRAIRDLNRYALARIDHKANTVQLHRLVQAALIGRMPPELRGERRHNAHVLLANANPNNPGAGGQWARYQALLPHVVVSEAIDCDDPWVRQLLGGMVRFLYFWGDHESSLALAKRTTDKWRAKFGDEDAETLSLLKFYAFVCRVMGDYATAAEVDSHAVSVYQRIASEDDEGTLDAILQVSSDLRAKGDYVAARDNDQLVLTRARRAFGDDDPTTLAAAHNLGVSLRLAGEFQAALQIDRETWQRRAVILGEDDGATLSTLNGVALDQREAGDYLGARLLQEETYARQVDVFRVSNPLAVRGARNLAVCRRRAGDLDGARALSEETLVRFQRRYGDVYPDTLATATNLAVDLRQTGDLRASKELDEQTAARYAQLLGEQHPFALLVHVNMAVTLRLLGEVDAAYRLNVVTLAALHESLHDSHPTTLACAVNLGSDYYALQNFEEALRQDTGALERLRRVSGDDHPTTLACALNLAMDYRATGRAAEGDTLRTGTVTRLRTVLGDDHPATLAAVKGFRANVDIAPMPM